VILKVRNGADIDVPLRFRSPATVTAQVTTDTDIDMIAIERALTGEEPRPQLRAPEAYLAWQLVTSPQEEAPDRPLAALLGVSDRTVCRWRNQHTRAGQALEPTPGGGEMKDRWEDRALCRTKSSEDFFPVGDVGTAARAVYGRAIKVCDRCPVREQCLRFALRAEGATPAKSRSGVFGGLTPAERFERYKQQSQPAAA
jgi:WhiB family redox-sensing transcriptional regulator